MLTVLYEAPTNLLSPSAENAIIFSPLLSRVIHRVLPSFERFLYLGVNISPLLSPSKVVPYLDLADHGIFLDLLGWVPEYLVSRLRYLPKLDPWNTIYQYPTTQRNTLLYIATQVITIHHMANGDRDSSDICHIFPPLRKLER